MLKNFKAYQAAIAFYKLCERVRSPRHLQDQLQRASSSVVLNLAEGTERGSAADQRRFFRIAMGSIRECQAILDLLDESDRTYEAKEKADHAAALIFKLIKSVEKNSHFIGSREQ